ncbi:MAG: hypothetical protein RIS35_650 [Pseudomonadota bacterium]|jgi:hypothetical protein
MSLLSDLFANGRVIDLVIALIVLEALALRLRPAGAAAVPLPTLLSGLGLLLAWRCSLAGWPWGYAAAALTAAGAAHGWDLWRHWQQR